MAVSYRNRLIEFNQRKHALIIKKGRNSRLSKTYFCEADYEFIRQLDPLVAKFVWQKLVSNIKLGGGGISAYTCTFCVYQRMLRQGCRTCEWGKNHGKCVDKTAQYKQFQKYLADNRIKTIYNKEYRVIIKEVMELIK